MEALTVSLALIVGPIAIGVLIGWALRRIRGGRGSGVVWTLVCVGVPLLAVPLYRRFPLIGFWDAGVELLLLSAGTLLSAHRAFATPTNVYLAAASTVVSLLMLELACRAFLPTAPGYPTAGGIHLLLADALRSDSGVRPADTISKEIVCSVVYGDQYPRLLSLPPDPSLVLPRTYTPRAGATRRVLHIGDSMVYGLGVERSETFTAVLERLEPGVEHINAGIFGTAPDAYLALLREWVARHPVDMVVMYPFEGNDVRDVDAPYPCCAWQPLLSYGSDGVSLRCPRAIVPDLSYATWTWLRYNSPPPYPLRALIGRSVAAAYLGATMVDAGMRASLMMNQSDDTRLAHIEAIFRTAREELQARHVSFVVVALPMQNRMDRPPRTHSQAYALVSAARRAGVPAVDASDPILDALANGQQLFLGTPQQPDVHFNPDGHVFLAKWLHEQLPAIVATESRR